MPPELVRCEWCEGSDLERAYHDHEWGVPLHDDRKLFEFLVLEGAQAGLSWATVLRKRDRYREVFDQFEPAAVAAYGTQKIASLLRDAGIIRNRLKVESAVSNARAFLEVQARHGSFDSYIWQFVDDKPLRNSWTSLTEVPANSEISDRMSRDLKQRGFRFVGSTICYAFMQATGMVNDHVTTCYRYQQLT